MSSITPASSYLLQDGSEPKKRCKKHRKSPTEEQVKQIANKAMQPHLSEEEIRKLVRDEIRQFKESSQKGRTFLPTDWG